MNVTSHIGRELFSADAIRSRVDALARELATHYGRDEFMAVALLKGSFVFVADLIRALYIQGTHPVVDFVALSSYTGTTSSGKVTLNQNLSLPVRGQRVLLVDDILDTGRTLQAARLMLAEQGASEVRTCVLLDKPSRRMVPVTADHVGFEIEDVFVVGYGLDYNNRYRHLPGLAALVIPSSPGNTP